MRDSVYSATIDKNPGLHSAPLMPMATPSKDPYYDYGVQQVLRKYLNWKIQSLCFTRIPSLKIRLLPFSLHSSSQSCEQCSLWHQGFPGLPGRRRLFPNSYVADSCQIKTPLLRRIITPSPCSTMLVRLKFLHPHCPEKQKHNPPCACPMVL